MNQSRGTIRSRGAVLPLLLVFTLVSVRAENPDESKAPVAYDEFTGMVIAPGWEETRNNCIACHSPRQFLQQSGSRNTWDGIITWMQKSAGLWELTSEQRTTILDYLAGNYGPKEASRREPLPPHLLPPDPYARSVEERPR